MNYLSIITLAALLQVSRLILRYWLKIEVAQRLALGEADFDVRARVSLWLIRCAALAHSLDCKLEIQQ